MNKASKSNKHNVIFNLTILLLSLIFVTLLCLYFVFWHNSPSETYTFPGTETPSTEIYTYDNTETYDTIEYTDILPTTSAEVKTDENIPNISIKDLDSVTFTDGSGNEQIFNVLGNIEYDEAFYVALLSAETDDKTQYIVFEISKNNVIETLIPVENNEDTKIIREALEKEIFGEYTKTEIVYKTVDDSYFEDAVFIGDSMIETFIRYSNVKTNSYYYRGIMISNILTKKFIETDGEMSTLEEAFRANPQYKKIYLMFGTNEQGWRYLDLFKSYYKDFIDLIRSYYPDAVIYVQSTFPVAPKAEKRTDAVYSNDTASLFRYYEKELCEEYLGKKVYYLDVASIMTGEDGYLLEGVSLDGIHPTLKYTGIWYEYLKEHAIDEERSL